MFYQFLLGAPLQLGTLSARLVRLWVNPAQISGLTTFNRYVWKNNARELIRLVTI